MSAPKEELLVEIRRRQKLAPYRRADQARLLRALEVLASAAGEPRAFAEALAILRGETKEPRSRISEEYGSGDPEGAPEWSESDE